MVCPRSVKSDFDPFFTTKVPGKGTVWAIFNSWYYQKSRGCIKVKSDPGKGTVFYIYLPRISELPDEEKAEIFLALGKHERILLVDDEKEIADIGASCLPIWDMSRGKNKQP